MTNSLKGTFKFFENLWFSTFQNKTRESLVFSFLRRTVNPGLDPLVLKQHIKAYLK